MTGERLAVESQGSGPAVVFLHGIGGTSNVFQIQAEALEQEHQVIRLDFAGAGRSAPTAAISVESHAKDVENVMNDLGVDRAVLVGHSMGTLVAREFARHRPQRVRGLALFGVVGAPPPTAAAAIRARAELLRSRGPVAIAPTILKVSLSEATRRHKPEVAAFVRELVMRQDPEGYAQNNEALAAALEPGPVDPRLPLLIVSGAEDALSPPSVGDRIAREHGAAVVEVIPAIGHWIPLEAATQSAEILASFISSRVTL